MSEAAMTDHRFERPLSPNDEFIEISSIVRDLDLSHLKTLAIQKGIERAKFVEKTIPKESTAIKIFHFLTLNRYRRGPMRYIDANRNQHLCKIENAIKCGLPIEIIISFFGYKALNQLKTYSSSGTEVDISEVGSILRFYEIVNGIQYLYKHGAVFKIACDGLKYSDAVGFTREQGHGYYKNVKAIAEYFNIQNVIHIFEESEFFPEDYKKRMEISTQETNLRYYYESRQGNDQLIKLIDQLAMSMLYIVPLPKYNMKTVVAAYCTSMPDHHLYDINRDAYELRMWLKHEALYRAIRYVGAYDAMKHYGLMEKIAPNALRGTVHPKEGQIGLYALNKPTDNIFPHHGQGVSSEFKYNPDIDDLRVRFRIDIERCNVPMVGVVLPPEKYPFSNGVHPFTIVDKKFLTA